MRLPIFPSPPIPAVQQVTPCQRTSTCDACPLHLNTPSGERCIPADGDVGDILVVGGSPTEFERRLARPMASPAGQWLRKVFEEKYPDRKVVYTNAIGCKLRRDDDDTDVPIEACRQYVAQDILDAAPKVIILLGSLAGESILGRGFQPLSVRKGYGWFFWDGEARPVFLLQNPTAIMGNRLLVQAFLDDLQAALAANPSPSLLKSEYTIVEDAETAYEAAEHLAGAPYVATDVETSGMMHEDNFRIECVAVSSGEHTYVWSRKGIESAEVREHLLFVLATLEHTSWNGQYDWTAFACDPLFAGSDDYGRPTSPMRLVSDARIKRKLIEADAKADLGTAAELIGMGGHKEEAHTLVDAISNEIHKCHMSSKLTPTGKARKPPELQYFNPRMVPKATWEAWSKYLDQGFEPVKFAYRFMPLDILHRYCARDALTTWHLEAWASDQLIQDEGLATIWDEVSQKSMWAYCAMRLNGMPLDAGALSLFQQFLETEMSRVKASIDGYCKDLNPLSPKQVGAYLQSVGIVPSRKTDSGAPSYSDESLEEYKDKHPMVDLVLHYRELQKQLGTYAIGFGHYISKDGRVHPSFLSDGTESGRASCNSPNLFNVSKGRTERKKLLADMLRASFICPPGWSFIEVDSGQIEIRGAAHLSGDQAMHEMLTSGTDFHMASAKRFAAVQGKDPETVTDMDRDNAKTSNFAGIYEIPCQLGFMLANRLGVDKKAGQQIADAMFQSYTGLRSWMDEKYSEAWETGISRTQWKGKPARRRPLWGMGKNPKTLKELESALVADRGRGDAKNRYDLNAARSTYNGPVQGSSVDVIASHLWETQQWLDKNTKGGQLILQVYDSIMVMVRDEDVDKTLSFLLSIMVEPLFGETPLTADAKVGKTWSGMKKIKNK